MSLKIYNSLSREKQEFTPPPRGKIGIYVCGPTVYDESHIGHARSAYIFDVIIKYLRYKFGESKVIFVRNVTDIDDKIINRARQEGGEEKLKERCKEIAEKYLVQYHEDMDTLGLTPPDEEPKATDLIEDMKKFIKILIDKDYAYVASGNVYFNVRKYEKYGDLSGQSLDDMAEGARVALDKNKKDPLDFALWKTSKENEPSWDSPWGKGRPGWHIECSVMSTKFLGNNFLIHGGGLDLKFPHHENEIAQTNCAGKRSADFWIHNGLLTIDRQKMAKSLGNFISIKTLLSRYHPEVLKLFFLSGHYRSPIDFTFETMDNITHARENFYKLFQKIDITIKDPKPPVAYKDAIMNVQIEKPKYYKSLFMKAMDDDFNMSSAIGLLHMVTTNVNSMIDKNEWNENILVECKEMLFELGGIFGLFKDKAELKRKKGKVLGISSAENIKVHDYCNLDLKQHEDKEIIELIEKREKARRDKNYKLADDVRKKLLDKGILIEDTKKGPVCRRID
jgi:cysteinyl-tRNA synthetase